MNAPSVTTAPRLSGSRVVVTGGARGIGGAIAARLAVEGADICILDRLVPEGTAHAAAIGGRFIEVDLLKPDDITRAMDEALTSLGGVDVLVNSAGIFKLIPLLDITVEDWNTMFSINTRAMLTTMQSAARSMIDAGTGGSIINLSSVAGRLGYPLRLPYAASKWAVVGLTKTLAAELGPDGIRVNAILPGSVEGPRIRAVIDAKANARGLSYEDIEAEYLSCTSLRRMVAAEDVAQMITFLCSHTGKNISGQAISVCGDVGRIP